MAPAPGVGKREALLTLAGLVRGLGGTFFSLLERVLCLCKWSCVRGSAGSLLGALPCEIFDFVRLTSPGILVAARLCFEPRFLFKEIQGAVYFGMQPVLG